MSAGRPTRLTPSVEKKVIKALKDGNYIETAAALAGISKSSIYEWLKRGAREIQRLEDNPRARLKKEEEPFVRFSDAVEKAQAMAEARDLSLIGQAAEGDWKAAAWRLERKFPDKWGRKDRLAAELEHSGDVGLDLVISYGSEDGDDDVPN